MTGASKHPVVRTYELDPVSESYALTGTHREQPKLCDPYDIDVDITLDALAAL